MRHLLTALCLLSAPALAEENHKERGEGFQLESTSPALPVIKFRGPKGAEAVLTDVNSAVIEKCMIPCEVTPNPNWDRRYWHVSIKGALWAKGQIQFKHRTAYQITVDDPSGAPAAEAAPAPSASAPPTPPVPEPQRTAPAMTAPAPGGTQGMDASSFQRLRGAIEKESMASSKMSALKTGVQKARLTVAQVGTLVDLFTYSEDKVNVVRLTRAGLVDPENGPQLLQHFTYDTDKDQVQALFNEE